MDQLLSVLRSAGESTRLRIISLLSKGELTVGEMVQILSQSQPRVSRHLKLMGESGVLDRFQEGTQVFYRLAQTGIAGKINGVITPLINPKSSIVADDLARLEAIRQERSERAQEYFAANALNWERIRSLYVAEDQVEQALLNLQGEIRVGSVLDVGTGTGRMLELFAPLADRAVGIDVSRDMLSIARSKLSDIDQSDCQVRLGDMYDLGVDDDSQDLILFHQVLHFAENPQSAIKEAARAVKHGGAILIADFAPHTMEFLRDEHAHRRLGFADDEVKAWADSAGLSVKSSTYLDGGELRVVIWKLSKELRDGI
jgi:ArsR family transcriptional regulator